MEGGGERDGGRERREERRRERGDGGREGKGGEGRGRDYYNREELDVNFSSHLMTRLATASLFSFFMSSDEQES